MKRRIAFIIAFCITLILGLTYTFLTSPEYSSVSKVCLSHNQFYYSEAFYKYLPDEADSLMVIPDYYYYRAAEYISDKLDTFSENLKSEKILKNVSNHLNGSLSEKEIMDSINVIQDRWTGIITLTTYSNTPELAYELNSSLLDEYVELKNNELEENYSNVLLRITEEIGETELFLEEFSEEKESGTEIDLVLNAEVEEATEKLVALNAIRQNLEDNKDYFTDRIEIIKSPDINEVKNSSNYFRNILLSIIAAVIAGIIAAFIVNYFKSPGNKK